MWNNANFNIKFTVRCEALERQNEETSSQNLEKEVEELKLQCKKLKVAAILCYLLNCIFASFSNYLSAYFLGRATHFS